MRDKGCLASIITGHAHTSHRIFITNADRILGKIRYTKYDIVDTLIGDKCSCVAHIFLTTIGYSSHKK